MPDPDPETADQVPDPEIERCACGSPLRACDGCYEARCYSCDPEGSHADCDA